MRGDFGDCLRSGPPIQHMHGRHKPPKMRRYEKKTPAIHGWFNIHYHGKACVSGQLQGNKAKPYSTPLLGG